jgi:alkaline phosphatase D
VASEIVGSAITSSSNLTAERGELLKRDNPHVHLANGEKKGYALVELGQAKATAELRALEDVTDADSQISTLATFEIEDGRPGLHRA